MRKLEFKPEIEHRSDGNLLPTPEIFGHKAKSLSSKVTHEAAKQMTSGTGLLGQVVVDDLRPTQPWIQEDKVEAYLKNWQIESQRVIDVILNSLNGKLYVWGGHHHVAAAKQAGQKIVMAMVYNAHSSNMFDDPEEFENADAAKDDGEDLGD